MIHNIDFYTANYERITALISKLPHTYTTLLSENGTLKAYSSPKTFKQFNSKIELSLSYVNKKKIPATCDTPKLLDNYALINVNTFTFKSQKDYFSGRLNRFKLHEKILNQGANCNIEQDLYLTIPFYKSRYAPVGFVFIMIKPEEQLLFSESIIQQLSDDFTNNYKRFMKPRLKPKRESLLV